MATKMNNNRIDDVLARQKRGLGMDTIVALLVTLGLLISVLGLRSASHSVATAAVQQQPSPAVSVAAHLRAEPTCTPDSGHIC